MATDGGSSFGAVLKAVLPGVPRILCLYHIGENIRRHLFSKLGPLYDTFYKSWSRLAGSVQTEEEFELDWTELVSTYGAAQDYLTKQLYPDKQLWCHVWTRRYTTFGARTTQRCESVNRVLKYLLEHNSTLETLFSTMLAISERWATRRDQRVQNDRFTNHAASGPVYTAAARHLTRDAAELVYSESQFISNYTVFYFEQLPPGCSTALSAPSAARVNYYYLYSAAESRQPTVNIQSSSSELVVQMQSTCSQSTADLQSNGSESTVEAQSISSESTVDPYHPHSFHDLPNVGGAYYVRHRIDSEAGVTHWVRVREGSVTCTDCKFNTNYLLPCRHILAVNQLQWPKSSVFHQGQCHRRWWLEQGSPPISLPSTTAVVAPLSAEQTDAPMQDEDDTGQLSKDSIYGKWIAAAGRACGFIQQHGDPGLQYSLDILKQLITDLVADGKGVPQQYKVTTHTSPHSVFTVNF